jgi:hypothetical protein
MERPNAVAYTGIEHAPGSAAPTPEIKPVRNYRGSPFEASG